MGQEIWGNDREQGQEEEEEKEVTSHQFWADPNFYTCVHCHGWPSDAQHDMTEYQKHQELVGLLQSIEAKVRLLDGHIAVLADRIKRLEDICYP